MKVTVLRFEEWGFNRAGVGFIFSISIFDRDLITFSMERGCIQDWGCIQVDTVILIQTYNYKIFRKFLMCPQVSKLCLRGPNGVNDA